MVHLSSIPEDFFIFAPQRATLTGKQTCRVIALGDNVQVQIHRVDRFKKQVDFRPYTEGQAPTKRRSASFQLARSTVWLLSYVAEHIAFCLTTPVISR